MKKYTISGVDQDYYIEQLSNGLEIILLPYHNQKKNYYISYATKYGSEINTFIPHGEKKYKTVSNGIAHFLEHKMFEQEDGVDPFKFFSASGTGANAFTSFNSTQYICYGTKEFEKNLSFLLSYVHSPYFTTDNVEKEKGIIKEEIKMYEDIPESVLENKLRECIYQNHPRRIDIAGSVEDIDHITKEELYTCYHTFYQPNNMILVISGKFDMDKAISIIHEKVSHLENLQEKIRIREVKEPKGVCKKEEELSINLRVPKIGLGYKMSRDLFTINDDFELDMYLKMVSSILFGPASLFKERVTNHNLMTSIYYEWDCIKEYRTLLIFAETENPELLIKEIENELHNIHLSDDDFERIKKVWIANEVKLGDFSDTMANDILFEKIQYNRIYDHKIDMIRKMSKKKLDQIISSLTFNYRSKVILLPNKIIAKEK